MGRIGRQLDDLPSEPGVQQGFEIDRNGAAATGNDILEMEVYSAEQMEKGQQASGPAVEDRTVVLGDGIVRSNKLGPSIGVARQNLGSAQCDWRLVVLKPPQQHGPRQVDAKVLRLVDNLVTRSEGQRDDPAPATMWVRKRRRYTRHPARFALTAEEVLNLRPIGSQSL